MSKTYLKLKIYLRGPISGKGTQAEFANYRIAFHRVLEVAAKPVLPPRLNIQHHSKQEKNSLRLLNCDLMLLFGAWQKCDQCLFELNLCANHDIPVCQAYFLKSAVKILRYVQIGRPLKEIAVLPVEPLDPVICSFISPGKRLDKFIRMSKYEWM